MGEQISTRWDSGRRAGGRAIIRRTTRTRRHSPCMCACGGETKVWGRLAANESQGRWGGGRGGGTQLRLGGLSPVRGGGLVGSAAMGALWAQGTGIALRLHSRANSRAHLPWARSPFEWPLLPWTAQQPLSRGQARSPAKKIGLVASPACSTESESHTSTQQQHTAATHSRTPRHATELTTVSGLMTIVTQCVQMGQTCRAAYCCNYMSILETISTLISTSKESTSSVHIGRLEYTITVTINRQDRAHTTRRIGPCGASRESSRKALLRPTRP